MDVADGDLARRSVYLAYGIDGASHVGIEIGALDNPVFSRIAGKTKYVDFATTSELKEKTYAADPGRIVEVDYVWSGSGSLAEVVGGDNCFDYAIASHVIEHIPNVIGWFRGITAVLKPNGRFNLAIPDRRFTFDYQRRETTLAQWIEADILQYTRPSPGQVFDHASQVRHIPPGAPWISDRPAADYPLLSGPDAMRVALEKARQVAENGTYLDTHCSVFTPISFFGLFAEITKLGLVDLCIDRAFITAVADPQHGKNSGYEFFVNLRKPDTLSRDDLIRRAEAVRDGVRSLNRQFSLLGGT